MTRDASYQYLLRGASPFPPERNRYEARWMSRTSPYIKSDTGSMLKNHHVSIVFFLYLIWPFWGWGAPQHTFESVHYDLDVTYHAKRRVLHGHADIQAVWLGSSPLTELYFFLPPNTLSRRDPREPAAFSDQRYVLGFDRASIRVQRVWTDARHELSFQVRDDDAVPPGHVPDRALLHVTLPRPYAPGERFALSLAFTTQLPEAKNWGVYRGTMALDGRWYPMLVPRRRGDWIWGMQSFVHASYQLRLTTDANQDVVASVPWSEQSWQGDRQVLRGHGALIYHLGLSSRATWHRVQNTDHMPPLQIVSQPADTSLASHLLQILPAILAFYDDQFGLKLSAPLFTVVVVERDQSWPFSAVADNLVFLSRDLVRVPDLIHKLSAYFLARGVAQQWWGLKTAYHLDTERWIGAGLVSFMAFQWLEQHYGADRNFLSWQAGWLPNFSLREQSNDIPYRRFAVHDLDQIMRTSWGTTRDREGLRFSYEKKGALVYSMLYNLLGAEAFREFLHQLGAEAGGMMITTEDVQRAAERVSGKDLEWFFQQWVKDRVKLDYAVGKLDVSMRQDAQGQRLYVNKVEIHRLGEAVMPVEVTLITADGQVHIEHLAGQARTETVVWEGPEPVRDVQIDADRRLPDVQPLNNHAHVPYTIRPLIDFPRLDSFLLYPFVLLDNNFIDGYTPRFVLAAQYLDDLQASISLGYKTALDEPSVEGSVRLQRFPHRDMSTGLTLTDRLGARNVTLSTGLRVREYRKQYRLDANLLNLGYNVSFLESQETYRGEPVPDTIVTSGRLNSIVFSYLRDTRIPEGVGAPTNIIPEPLAYGYVLHLDLELASKALGSEFDMQQVRWAGGPSIRLWNQTMLTLRLFGGWSSGTVPLQRKMSLAGLDTVRAYAHSLALLGDRMLGWRSELRFPVIRDSRLEDPWRWVGLRYIHIGPFIDGGWVWDRGEALDDTKLRYGAGLRLVLGIGFFSYLRFEMIVDVAHPLDAYGRDAGDGVQTWFRVQSTSGGGTH